MTNRLFVYGTLRRGSRNSMHHLLARGATLVGPARMRGRLFDLGAYPGFVPSDTLPAWVRGELYALANSTDMLARLDAYEGCGPEDVQPHEFRRIRREARGEGGAISLAWVYAYGGPLTGKAEILSGDYCRPADN
jgi:gamma-glutamylcyclotransferase (GGCT)/AIG2-like uncharacterized protein YtfP